MAKKKIFMSVTATAAIAATFMAADNVDAATYKVQSGDSLWNIAQKHNTSVATLKSLNNLTGDLIFPNQVITTDKAQSSSSSSNSSNSSQGSSSSSGSTYTVKSGDTLSGIASKNNISLTNLMKWNNLNTTLTFPGNKLSVGGASSSGSSSSSSSAGSSTSSSGTSSSSTTYVVKSGDSLSAIGSRHGVSIANLKSWNNLSSDLIRIGQKLSINGAVSSGSVSPPKSSNSSAAKEEPSVNLGYNVNSLVDAAKGVQGVKYVWGGQTASGFDCSGFIHYAYNKAGKTSGRTSTDGYYSRSYEVSNPQVGDLVFFKGTYRAGISHMGIYLGNNQFIHAGSSTGVTVTSLSNSYWKQHFDSFKRFY